MKIKRIDDNKAFIGCQGDWELVNYVHMFMCIAKLKHSSDEVT